MVNMWECISQILLKFYLVTMKPKNKGVATLVNDGIILNNKSLQLWSISVGLKHLQQPFRCPSGFDAVNAFDLRKAIKLHSFEYFHSAF